MAVKARRSKRNRAKENFEKAVKIKCCFCELNGKCSRQSYKEDSERLGFITYCTLTPNVTKKQRKKKSVK